MPLEIERKFLVEGLAWRSRVHRSVPMTQGYLTSGEGRASVRVRLEGDRAAINVKAAVVGPARAEFEYPIPAADARAMLETVCTGVIEKVRHYLEHAGHTWEIDEFGGDNEGLVTAEIELGEVDEPFDRPAWLGAEVTGERRYYNQALALRPYSRWKR